MAQVPTDKLKDAKVIFMMGGPGSGKATQCSMIAAKYGLTYISSGDLLRTEVALGTEGGRRLKRIMMTGEQVPLIDVLHLVKDAMLAKAPDSPGFLIEGYPRDSEQAFKFENELAPCQVVIFLDVTEELMMQRLMRRSRDIDSKETILTKLQLYHDRTVPVIEEFEKRKVVIRINGEGTPEDVFQRIQTGLTKFRGRGTSGSQSTRRVSPSLSKPQHRSEKLKTSSHSRRPTDTSGGGHAHKGSSPPTSVSHVQGADERKDGHIGRPGSKAAGGHHHAAAPKEDHGGHKPGDDRH